MKHTQVIKISKIKIAIVSLLLSLAFQGYSQSQLTNGNKLFINLSTIFYQPHQFKSFGYGIKSAQVSNESSFHL